MNVEGLSGLVNRVIAWADGMQRRHGVLGFPYAVVKKYGDDEGGRQAALITYYGFLSIFPLLLLGVAVLSRVLADHQDLRRRLTDAIVPPALQPTIEHSLATLPSSTIPFVAGLIGLLLSGTGVVFSAYQTLNHVAVVRHRRRAGFVSRYLRVFAVLMLGALAVGTLTVVATALPSQPGVQRAAAVAGSALVVFAVLLLGAKVLLARPAPVRALWPGALAGAVAVTVVLTVGAPLLARLVAKAGPVYGSFATVAGMFASLPDRPGAGVRDRGRRRPLRPAVAARRGPDPPDRGRCPRTDLDGPRTRTHPRRPRRVPPRRARLPAGGRRIPASQRRSAVALVPGPLSYRRRS